MKWKPIATVPEGVKFLGYVDEDWIEGFIIEEGVLCYAAGQAGPTMWGQKPTHWASWPNAPE